MRKSSKLLLSIGCIFLIFAAFAMTSSADVYADPELKNGETVNNLSGQQGQWVYYMINVPSGASNLKVSMSGGSGEADLYTKFGKRPTSSDWDCRPYIDTNNENCEEASPKVGAYYIGLYGYYAFQNISLTASYTTTPGPEPEPTPGGMANGETVKNIAASKGQWKYFKFNATQGAANMIIRIINGNGDADMYVKFGSKPTASVYDCAPAKGGNNETCKIPAPKVGTYHIGLLAYSAFDGVYLTTSFIDNGKFGLTIDQAHDTWNQNKTDPNFIVLDVRTPTEYNAGHIVDAVAMDFYCTSFHDKFTKLDPNKRFLIFCKTENRSSQTAMMMKYNNFKNFQFAYGGITEWKAKGFPLTDNPNPDPPGP